MRPSNPFFSDPDPFGRVAPRATRRANDSDSEVRSRTRYSLDDDSDDGDDADASADRVLLKRVQAYLVGRGLPSFRKLDLYVKKGVLHVHGETRSHYERQLLMQSARRVSGVKDVIAEVTVRSEAGELNEDEFAEQQEEERPRWWRKLPSPGVMVAVTALASMVAAHFLLNRKEEVIVAKPIPQITGKFLFQGEPAGGAYVTFHPEGDESPKKKFDPDSDDGEAGPPPPIVANVGADGTFRFPDRGLPVGRTRLYTVTAKWCPLVEVGSDFEPGPDVIPKAYRTAKTSPLIVELKKGMADVGKLEIK